MSGLDLIQGSDEWRAYKCGKVSASRVGDLLAEGKGLSRAGYFSELVVERLTGTFTESFESADMRRGRELEPQARSAYSFLRRSAVEQVGFVDHPRIAMAGCSPDGRVGQRGLMQIKVPKANTHLEYLDGASLPKAYRDQVQFELATEDRDWCDWCSFHPSFPAGMDLHVRRIPRDSEYIAKIETEVRKFLSEIEAKVAALRARYGAAEAA